MLWIRSHQRTFELVIPYATSYLLVGPALHALALGSAATEQEVRGTPSFVGGLFEVRGSTESNPQYHIERWILIYSDPLLVLSAVGCVLSAASSSSATRFLSSGPCQSIGSWSYGIYLFSPWSFVAAGMVVQHAQTNVVFAFMIYSCSLVASLLLARFSFMFFESKASSWLSVHGYTLIRTLKRHSQSYNLV